MAIFNCYVSSPEGSFTLRQVMFCCKEVKNLMRFFFNFVWLSSTLVHDLPVERTLIYVCCAEEQSRLFVSLSLDAIVCRNLLMSFVHMILFICSSAAVDLYQDWKGRGSSIAESL